MKLSFMIKAAHDCITTVTLINQPSAEQVLESLKVCLPRDLKQLGPILILQKSSSARGEVFI
jgi:hypothetical protein